MLYAPIGLDGLDVASKGTILGMGSANEWRRYNVASVLIGWHHTQDESDQMNT